VKKTEAKFALYEYIKYWAVTLFVLILAVPVGIIKTTGFLIKATGAPLKSIKHIIGFIIVIILAVAVFLWYKIYVPYDIGDETISVMVQAEDSFAKVITELKTKGVVKDDYLFRQLSIITGVDRDLTPGRYDFSGRVSLKSVLQKFIDRNIATVKITIPEGLSARQIAGLLDRAGLVDSAAFGVLAYDSAFTVARYELEGMEGFLFPETYRFWYGMSADMIIDVLFRQFRNLTGEVLSPASPGRLSEKEIVTLASIIEAEALFADEMPAISSVYHNRLDRGMLLQADPTVIYAIGGLDRPLWYKDLSYDSPYNTYKHKGLPPGPINNPGLEAIKAAISPAETDYLYFVADGTGRHVFSRTLKEHNRAKKDYKKKLKDQAGS
jgi:UPF0755 protein